MPPETRVGRRSSRRSSTRAPDPVRLLVVLLAVVVALIGGATGASAAGASAGGGATIASANQPEPTGEPDDADEGTGEEGRDPLPVPEPSTDDANQRADEILDDPKFDEPPKGVLDHIIEWIVEQLDKIRLPGGGGGIGGSQVIGWIFIAALAGLAIYLVSRTRLSRRPDRGDPAFLVDTEQVRSHHEWVAEAEAFEAAGQWKQALRCRFRALVAALIERGVVRDIPGRTTGEYRVEVGRNAASVAASFAAAAELFDRAWYGDEATGPDENVRFRALADEVVLGADVEAAARLSAAVPVGSPSATPGGGS